MNIAQRRRLIHHPAGGSSRYFIPLVSALVPELWIPGAAQPSLDDFVAAVHRQIERFTAGHDADETLVEVELADGERLALRALSAEPGFGFVTLTVHPEEGGPQQLIVPVATIRRVTLGPAEQERARLGFSLPEQKEGPEPAA
jgi:hypothetical protein